MKHLNSVKANETLRLTGPVTIAGNIGEGACVSIDNGNLLVSGKVGDNVTITCTARKTGANSIEIPTSSGVVFFSTGSNAGIEDLLDAGNQETDGSVMVNGDIADSAIVNCDGDFTCNGNIADQFTLNAKKSNITLTDVGEESNINVQNGNIAARDIGSNTKIITHHGNIKAVTAKRNSQLTAHKGNITLYTAEANTLLAAPHGNVTVATADKTSTLKTKNRSMQDNSKSIRQTNKQGPDVTLSKMFMNNNKNNVVISGVTVTQVIVKTANSKNRSF